MFLEGSKNILGWLQGHFPNMCWAARDADRPNHCIIVGVYRDKCGSSQTFSLWVASTCHPVFLDSIIEYEIEGREYEIGDNWKGEYVEYDGPPVL